MQLFLRIGFGHILGINIWHLHTKNLYHLKVQNRNRLSYSRRSLIRRSTTHFFITNPNFRVMAGVAKHFLAKVACKVAYNFKLQIWAILTCLCWEKRFLWEFQGLGLLSKLLIFLAILRAEPLATRLLMKKCVLDKLPFSQQEILTNDALLFVTLPYTIKIQFPLNIELESVNCIYSVNLADKTCSRKKSLNEILNKLPILSRNKNILTKNQNYVKKSSPTKTTWHCQF